MNTDTSDFLEALLFVADSPDHDERPLEGASIHQFSPEFVSGVDSFIDGFRSYLEAKGFDMDRLDSLERSFGGNVFFSLSGHGVGFFDESGNYPDGDSELGDELQSHLDAYSGNHHRFEGLDGMLDVSEDGVIDLSILPEFIAEYRAKLFTVATA